MRKSLGVAVAGVLVLLVIAAFCTAAERRGKPRPRRKLGPKVGQMAPDFELIRLDAFVAEARKKAEKEKEEKRVRKDSQPDSAARGNEKAKKEEAKLSRIKLSSFRGKRPVVLIFASYT